MYTEENIKGRFPLRDVLLKVMIVIIFIILILFVIAKVVLSSDTKKSTSNYDEVFSENLKAMEEVAYTYFTEDKLPTEVGANNQLTLRQMFNLNLLNAFTDADGKACDVNDSYIRITKNDDDYTLKVNLKCEDKEDYLLTKVNTYEYCENDICPRDASLEKEDETDEEEEVTKEVEITEEVPDNSNTSISSSTSSSNAGNSNNETSISPPKVKEVMYEYKKETVAVLSNWSSWSGWQLNKGYTAVKCATNDTSCLQEIQLYSRREVVGTDASTGKQVTKVVTYYSTRTRSIVQNATTDVKWSTYNDTVLLNNGYVYTGNTK